MNKINCSVNNCSHNSSNTCYADRVNISGHGSKCSENTCCASFLDEKLYGNLTNNVNPFTSSTNCDVLVCGVETCKYNSNHLCSLDSIDVGGSFVNLYSETSCNSFCPR